MMLPRRFHPAAVASTSLVVTEFLDAAMPNPVLLNNVDHHDLRVVTASGRGHGDEVSSVPTFPAEFRDLQAYYPIAFHVGENGQVQPLALLGLRQGENLFLQDDHWDAPYLPLAIRRQPFLIGLSNGEPLIHIDLDHPRVSREAGVGEALFLEFGGNTPFLEHAASVLRSLHDGLHENLAFGQVLQQHALLEPFVLDVQLDNGEQHRLAGLHAIAEERLHALDGSVLQALARNGYLQAIHMAMASLSHLRDLIDRANRRDAGQR